MKMLSNALIIATILLTTILQGIAEDIRWGKSWGFSVAGSVSLNVAGWKDAHTIVPKTNMVISQINIYGGTYAVGSPIYHIGIQGDDGTTNNFPNGTWLGGTTNYAITDLSTKSAWTNYTLPLAVTITNGTRYHIVIETITANAGNTGSTLAPNQPLGPDPFRPGSGIYDTAVGREHFKSGVWAREAGTLTIVAVDTNNSLAIGQPYNKSSTYWSISKDWRQGQTFTLNAPSESTEFYLKTLGFYVTSNSDPNDDLRIHIERMSDDVSIYSSVLISTNNLVSGFITTNVPADTVILENGVQYRMYCESTNCTSGYYRMTEHHGGGTGKDYIGAASATFQGADEHMIKSFRGGAWAEEFGLTDNTSCDTVFELILDPIPPDPVGTVITIL